MRRDRLAGNVLGCSCNHHTTSCSTSHRSSTASHQDIAPYNDQADVTCPRVDSVSLCLSQPVLSKVDDFPTFKKVEVHAKNSTF